MAKFELAAGKAMPMSVESQISRRGRLYAAATRSDVKGRYILLSPFLWPMSRHIEFDLLLCTSLIDRVGDWRVRTLRWREATNRQLWNSMSNDIAAGLFELSQHNVRTQVCITEAAIEAVWPRFNQVLDFKLRPDHAEMNRRIDVVLRAMAQKL